MMWRKWSVVPPCFVRPVLFCCPGASARLSCDTCPEKEIPVLNFQGAHPERRESKPMKLSILPSSIRWLVIAASIAAVADQKTTVQSPRNDQSRTLFARIREGDSKTITASLKNHSLLESKDEDGNTPLMHAAFYLDAKAIELFLTEGADPNATNKTGATALM